MLRTFAAALSAAVLSAALGGAASAQTVTFNQNAANNYALIEPNAVSLNVEIIQVGRHNSALTLQGGPNNTVGVDQWGTTNKSWVDQRGVNNTAVIIQQHNFAPVESLPTQYVGEPTPYGYLSEFNSGGVSILALTGAGNTLISSFGRSH